MTSLYHRRTDAIRRLRDMWFDLFRRRNYNDMPERFERYERAEQRLEALCRRELGV